MAITHRGLTRRDGLWLGGAILAHACLFLIPLSRPPAPAVQPQPLSIELRPVPAAIQPIDQEFAEQEPQKDNEEPVPKEPEPLESPLIETPPAQVALETQEPALDPESEPETAKRPTTATLLHALSDFKWELPDQNQYRTLGVAAPRSVPKNWQPGISLEDNLFNGMVVPNKVEVVDRWTSADGSHNVVINTPTGHTLCGQARPWDPLQPLVEHVMQFRSCAGGGKRTFEMSERYQKRRHSEEVANSTTN